MIDAFRYHITVSKVCVDGEDYFVTTVKELPDVRAYGDTYQEAFDLAIDTIETAAEMFAEEGRAFPAPAEKSDDYSGRVTLRMPKSLHRVVAEQAEAEDVSLNQYILSVLAHATGVRQVAKTAFPRNGVDGSSSEARNFTLIRSIKESRVDDKWHTVDLPVDCNSTLPTLIKSGQAYYS